MSLDQQHELLASRLRRSSSSRVLFQSALRRFLPRLAAGRLRLLLPSGFSLDSGMNSDGPDVTIEIRKWRALWRLAFGGEIGFAQSYIDGDCSTADLACLFDLVMLNEAACSRRTSSSRLARALQRLQHYWNKNTLAGSRSNIAAHYDIGNRFYEAWLDRGMNYSSALYHDPDASLEEAQVAKSDRVIELLAPGPGEQVLEIGCGWGGLAEQLLRAGSRVTAVTLSPAQVSFARQRLAGAIAAGDADLQLLDYREIQGRFDRIVSIEMMEAVGEAFWPIFFATLRERLRKRGAIVLQVITICETRFEAYRTRPDFIQHCVFPGGMLPTVSLIRQHAERAGLELVAHQRFGESYALTLAEWRQRFHRAWPGLAGRGYDERFHRLWDYYLAYCETGFRFKATDVGLFKFQHSSSQAKELF